MSFRAFRPLSFSDWPSRCQRYAVSLKLTMQRYYFTIAVLECLRQKNKRNFCGAVKMVMVKMVKIEIGKTGTRYNNINIIIFILL